MKSFKGVRLVVFAAAGAVALIAAVFWWSMRDTTVYANGFTEEAFRQLKPGMAVENVYSLVGEPLLVRHEDAPEKWWYSETTVDGNRNSYVFSKFFDTPRCVVFSDTGFVIEATGDGMEGIHEGLSADEVVARLGEPGRRTPAVAKTLHFSEPGGEGLFKARIVAIDSNNNISDVFTYQFYD